jgi:ribonuclease PH
MNIVCTGAGDFVEVQGTGEQSVFHRRELDVLVDLGAAGCAELARAQARALGLAADALCSVSATTPAHPPREP